MKSAILFFLLAFLTTLSVQAQSPFKDGALNYAQYITPSQIKQHVYVLASDSLEGRETGKPGQFKAADYLVKQFQEIGLQPINTEKQGAGYFQNLNIERIRWKPSYMLVGSDTLKLFKDFYAKGEVLIPQETSMTAVFAGYGIDTLPYNDYKSVTVAGRAVFILQGEPVIDNISLLTGTTARSDWSTNWQKKAVLAYAKGAAAVFIVSPIKEDLFVNGIKRMRETRNGYSLGLETELAMEKSFFISEQQMLDILGVDSMRLSRWKSDKNAPKQLRANTPTLQLRIQAQVEKMTTQNVLGVVPGSDLRDEYIFVSAHYDHLGKKNDSTIFYGADDDGSGTASLLSMANAFMQAYKVGKGPRRSIVFTAFTGEEMGLLGSSYYSSHPIFPIKKSVVDLNIDMIGRIDEEHPGDSNYVYLIGSDRLSTELHQLSEETNKTYTHLSLDYTYNDPKDPNQLYYRSDHYNFAKKGIPVIFYFTGLHEDYHQITDTPNKLLYIKTSTIAKLVFLTAWQLANQDHRIQVDVKQ
ncbi:MAG: peptidase [Chitinophagaceae bacterium]|nr:peptidase [Chitinophagaceae bacterium]